MVEICETHLAYFLSTFAPEKFNERLYKNDEKENSLLCICGLAPCRL